jgi:signal peptidase I
MNQLRNIAKNLIFAVGISIFLNIVLGNYIVDGQSMAPTLNDSQRLFVNKFIYLKLPDSMSPYDRVFYNQPKRGEVVVFMPPYPYDSMGKSFVKRIIAGPGDTVENKSGIIYVNDRPFMNNFGNTPEISEQGVVIVPDNYYYVLGDNRNHSNDSRSFGLIHRSSIKGRVWFIYWPFYYLKVFDYNFILDLEGA